MSTDIQNNKHNQAVHIVKTVFNSTLMEKQQVFDLVQSYVNNYCIQYTR